MILSFIVVGVVCVFIGVGLLVFTMGANQCEDDAAPYSMPRRSNEAGL